MRARNDSLACIPYVASIRHVFHPYIRWHAVRFVPTFFTKCRFFSLFKTVPLHSLKHNSQRLNRRNPQYLHITEIRVIGRLGWAPLGHDAALLCVACCLRLFVEGLLQEPKQRRKMQRGERRLCFIPTNSHGGRMAAQVNGSAKKILLQGCSKVRGLFFKNDLKVLQVP